MDIAAASAGTPAGIRPAFAVALVGLPIPAVLVFVLSRRMADGEWWNASKLASLAGLFTGIVGTLVGAFLGAQAGAQGEDAAEKQAVLAAQRTTKAEDRVAAAEQKFMRALIALPTNEQQKFSK